MRWRCLTPFSHAVRILAGVFFYRLGGTTVGVTFTKHRIDRATNALAVAGADGLVFVRLRRIRVVRQGVALALQLFDARNQLPHRGADVRQLDDVGIGLQSLLPPLEQGVGELLVVSEEVRKLAQNAGSHRYIGLHHMNAGRRGEGADQWQKRRGGQTGGFVGQRVDDGRLLGAHLMSPK